MANTTPVIIIGAAPPEETLIRRQLEGVAEVLGAEPDPGQALPRVRQAGNSIAVLCLDRDRDAMLTLAKVLSRSNGSAPIMVSRERDSETILTAMRAGARDFAYLDEKEQDVRRAVLNLGELTEPEEATGGKMIAVFGGKGGCGATTLATNVGGAILAENADARVVLVDLDLQMGDVLVFLDLASRYGFFDILRNLHRLDEDLVHRSLTAHTCGLRVLAQGDQLEEAEELGGDNAGAVLSFLKRHYDYVIVDGLRDFREVALVALDGADRIALTMTPDVPALKNAYRCLGLFKQLGYGPEKVKLVLNRLHKKGLDLGAAADALGRSIDATVANDFPTVSGAIDRGELLSDYAPRARVTRDVQSILPTLGVDLGDDAKASRRGFLGRLAR
jgi:pilus assembly protein CpaE